MAGAGEHAPPPLPAGLAYDTRLAMDGRAMLGRLPDGFAPVAFLDPQYRGVLDHLAYGNEGKARGKARAALRQMAMPEIREFIAGLDRVLVPSGHLFLWLDKFHLCSGIGAWLAGTSLETVDLLTWDKGRIGMGYRTRRTCEYLAVLQKKPPRAKGVWRDHAIPDVVQERPARCDRGTHRKPVGLQARLLAAVTVPGDVVVDPAAGTFSVLDACRQEHRAFLGCDVAPR